MYYADTYREGKEYFSIAHPRVAVISGADAATFRYIDRAYARDATHVYYEGVRHGVKETRSRSRCSTMGSPATARRRIAS